MANLSIAKIGQKIFNPTKAAGKSVASSSNPFAASTFKGNILSADVFNAEQVKAKNKLTYSALVGSIGEAFPTYRKAVESVVAFGNRMKTGMSSAWHKISEIGNMEVAIDFASAGRALKSRFSSMMDSYGAQSLSKKSVSELEAMLKSELSINAIA